MPDPAIQAFFAERKEAWLKKSLKASMSDEETQAKHAESEMLFSGEQWLPHAAKRAGQISISTHPCTFSHPSARKNKNGYVTSIIADAVRQADGYLRTGNVEAESDALGNAAALDVYKFLNLTMQDGESLLKHIQQDSDTAKALLSIQSENYQTLKDGFLAMASSSQESVTSSKIKQVYFPVDDHYHQLSILSNSGMIYELRKRIDRLRFSEEIKQLRTLKRNNEYSDQGFAEIYNITTIGYGGTKPQNISVLNNQNGGKARLLLSTPPHLAKRDIRFPTRNFFVESIRYYDVRDSLNKLHHIFQADSNSDIPRRNLEGGRDQHILAVFDAVIERMAVLRQVAREQYREDSSHLDHYQKVWLCPGFETERAEANDWLDQLCKKITHWLLEAYKKTMKKALVLGAAEVSHIRQLIESHREVLR
ncbi:MAG: type I-F CRISPR-associated protein Csy1 [Pseudomonadales bacterium]